MSTDALFTNKSAPAQCNSFLPYHNIYIYKHKLDIILILPLQTISHYQVKKVIELHVFLFTVMHRNFKKCYCNTTTGDTELNRIQSLFFNTLPYEIHGENPISFYRFTKLITPKVAQH